MRLRREGGRERRREGGREGGKEGGRKRERAVTYPKCGPGKEEWQRRWECVGPSREHVDLVSVETQSSLTWLHQPIFPLPLSLYNTSVFMYEGESTVMQLWNHSLVNYMYICTCMCTCIYSRAPRCKAHVHCTMYKAHAERRLRTFANYASTP